MAEQIDLSALDKPEVLEILYPVSYPPNQIGSLPEITGQSNYIELENGVRLHCGLWSASGQYPTILYFHGNGETVADYQWLAPLYNERRINLFVVDYRGYGLSNGKPSVSNLLSDSHIVYQRFSDIVRNERNSNSIFAMGRSLGSIPAIEVALRFQEGIEGLIIESGTSTNLRRLWGSSVDTKGILADGSMFLNRTKIRGINIPTLIIHGEYDEIIPVAEAEELYAASGSKQKDMLIVPGAGHNDIMVIDQELYFNTIAEFVNKYKLKG